MYQKSKHNREKATLVRALLIIFVLAIIAAGAFFLLQGDDDTSSPESSTDTSRTINFDPPTPEEQSAGDEQKEEILKQEEEQQTLQDTANVVIVDANQYGQEIEVRAFVANVISDGTCTMTFENGNESLTKTVDAFADASTTPCINLVVPRSEFTIPGEWTVTVQYANDIIVGSASSTFTIE